MAHFAQLNELNEVIQVIVIANDILINDNEELGIQFCKDLLGQDTRWVQTSFNGNFRGEYAGIGSMYDPENDIFFRKQEEIELE